MNSQKKWYEELNQINPDQVLKMPSKLHESLILGTWKEPVQSGKLVSRIAVICEYKRDFLQFCKDNPDNSKLYFHVYDKESTAGYEFDNYIILDDYLKRFVNIVDGVKLRIR